MADAAILSDGVCIYIYNICANEVIKEKRYISRWVGG